MFFTSPKTSKMAAVTLKWGTLKGWNFENHKHRDVAQSILEEYCGIGASESVMFQKDTERQKDLIFQLIDLCDDGDIYLAWDGKSVSKEEAKEYINNYRS